MILIYKKKCSGIQSIFFLTYDVIIFNVPVRTCLIILSMICLHPERNNNADIASIRPLLHAFFSLVSGGIEEIRIGLGVYEGSLRDKQRRCMNTSVETGPQL